MAFNYSKFALLADKLVGKFGRSVTLTRSVRTPADSNKPWRGNTAAVDELEVIAAVVAYEEDDEKGEINRRTDSRGLISANENLPDLIDAFDTMLDGVYRFAKGELVVADTANFLDGETVTIGTKVYTFQAILTDVDGHVLIGADDMESLDNLAAAIELGMGSGTLYAASTTEHPTVEPESLVSASGNTTLTVSAKTRGTAANAIALADTSVAAAWAGATLSGGKQPGKSFRIMNIEVIQPGDLRLLYDCHLRA